MAGADLGARRIAPALAAGLAMLAAAAPAAGGELRALTLRGAEGSAVSNQPVRVSVLGSDGKEVSLDATTDAAGNLPFASVPAAQWTPKGASLGGLLRLPDYAIGQVRWSGEAPGSEFFVLEQGAPVDAGAAVARWAGAFYSGTADGAARPENAVDSSRRYVFWVPDRATLDRIPASLLQGAQYFPDPEDGADISIPVGSDPDATWAELLALEQAGVIEDLDYDYCREFFPEGAGEGDPTLAGWGDLGWVPRASFTPKLGWTGTLRDLAGAALADGAVLLSPLSGSPFYDPGWTPADAELPLLQRTGADGSFGLALGGLRGPLLTSVGYGWNSSSKLVLVSEPPSELAPPPQSPPPGTKTATPGGGTPASKPPPSKPEGDICGPDVTDYVLGSLEHMLATWDGWTPAQREANCSVLFNWKRFQAAWDMKPFAPSEGEDYMTHKFFQRAVPDVCAEPDWPCGNTVEFLGHCVSGQVVNYVQWGAMNELCDDEVLGFVALHARSFFSPDSTGQEAMRHLGAYFARYRGDSLDFRRRVMGRILRDEVAENSADWFEMGGTRCKLLCGEIADPRPWLDTIDWGFQWGDEFVTVTGRNLPKP